MVPGALTIVLAMNCTPTTLENRTNEWNRIDQKSAASATERCAVYYKEAPCLVKLIKVETNVYRAFCGERNEE